MSTSELAGHESVERARRIIELLVWRVAVACLHLGDEPAVVAHLRQRVADGTPVVVAEEEVRVDAVIAAPPAMLEHVLHVDARDAWPVHLDPLFGKPGIVNVADVE